MSCSLPLFVFSCLPLSFFFSLFGILSLLCWLVCSPFILRFKLSPHLLYKSWLVPSNISLFPYQSFPTTSGSDNMALTPALALAQFKHHQFFNHQFLLASGLNIAAWDFSLTILGDSDEELPCPSTSASPSATCLNTPSPAPLDLSIHCAQFFNRISDYVIIDWESLDSNQYCCSLHPFPF